MFVFRFLFYLCLASSLVPMVIFDIRQKNSYINMNSYFVLYITTFVSMVYLIVDMNSFIII